MTHVVVAAWIRAGRPSPNWQGKARTVREAPTSRDGICALTGLRGLVVPILRCVSDGFTSWDRLRHLDREDVGFSIPAAWAFRERVAMQRPHGLVGDAWLQLGSRALHDALMRLGPHELICVPQSRQKHLLPWAAWGSVRVDDETLRWGSEEVELLGAYGWLRYRGFNERAMHEPFPRFQLLARLDRGQQVEVLRVWEMLAPWRAHRAYLDVAALATRWMKET